MSTKQKNTFADKRMVRRAIQDSFSKCNPQIQIKNPVMFIVYVAAIMTTILYFISLFGIKDAQPGFILAIAIILWFTVLFANFAEAIFKENLELIFGK
jgi:potassium-transporting ATPase ATP-binding subunit